MKIRLLCGALAPELGLRPPSEERSQLPSAVKRFISTLHSTNQFALPSLDLVDNLSLLSTFDRLPASGASGVVELRSLPELVGAVSDLGAVWQLLKQIDSPSFAMWCGAHQSEARAALLELQAEAENALAALRSKSTSVISVIGASHFSIDRELLSIQQAAVLGLRVDQVVLVSDHVVKSRTRDAWSKKLSRAGAGSVSLVLAPDLGKYAKKFSNVSRRGRSLVSGDVAEVGDGQYVCAINMKHAGKLPLNIGVLGNTLIIELHGIRRFIDLPAACSRMAADRAHLDRQGISIHFTAKADLWPTM